MILYTPMQLELVVEGMEKMCAQVTRELYVGDVHMLVEDSGPGAFRVVKLLSTDPDHYLIPGFSPGQIINVNQINCREFVSV
ncbi:MAG: hypothetical protein VR69_09600 [Peptococcaceae bacterium BRH_c4b]|nr:MAG: hypothetical protein VR69_09600 [Peptococcaceae bacterium BRH_c4b]